MHEAWRWIALAGALTIASAVSAQDPSPPGFRLGDAARPDRYDVQLAIDPKETHFTGRVRIDVTFARAAPVLWLNATGLTVDAVEVEQMGARIAAKWIPGDEDHVGIAAEREPFAAGAAVVVLRYRGAFEALGTRGLFRQQDRGDWYVLSQFESTSARRAIPCFDEPGWKTPWRLTIDAPAGNEVASNTPLEGSTPMPGSTWRRHVFAATKPLPSYLVALAVGPFDVVDGGRAGRNGTPLRYLAPRGRGAEMRYAREATPRLLELLEDYFDFPYPFEKLDSVVIPNLVEFGAMENVGLVTYGARYILARPHEEHEAFRRRYAGVAAHEIAHMWFGNLVTLAWWNDIWLNEAFATWAGDKARNRFGPQWDDGVRAAQMRAKAIGIDRLATTRVIANPVNVKGDLGGAFDAITYDKGAQVLAMFEAAFTPEKFRAGVQLFLRRHAWGTATSRDFFAAVGEASGQEEAALRAFAAFIEQPGAPLVDAALRCDARGASVEVSQSRLRPLGSTAADMRWSTPMCIRYRSAGKVAMQCDQIEAPAQRIALRPATKCPDWLVGNAGGVGHYVMRYDAALGKRNAASLAEVPRHEAVALVSDATLLWESGLTGAAAAIDWARAGLAHRAPAVRQTAAALLGKLQEAELAPAAARARDELVAKRLVPIARQLDWVERPGEGYEAGQLRAVVMPLAAKADAGLRASARAQAMRWLADRASIGAAAPAVMETAARFADAATYEALEAATLASVNDTERNLLLNALGATRDPALRGRALALARNRLEPGGTYTLLHAGLADAHNRRATFEFLQAHYDALAAKMAHNMLPRLLTPMAGLCTPADRDAYVAFFRERAPKSVGGGLRYAQALEAIEICIARQSQDTRVTDLTNSRLRSSSFSLAASSPPPISSIASSP